VIDTGFNGSFTLPPGLIASLGLPWLCQQQGILADGNVQIFDVYSPLIGMALLQGCELRIQVLAGGKPAPGSCLRRSMDR